MFRVWRRPDVSREVGASFALEMVEVFRRMAAEPWPVVRGVLYDLREATTTWGPVTEAAIGRMCALIETSGKRLAVVAANDAVQLVHVSAVIRRFAPTQGRVFGSISSAERWVTMKRPSRG